MPRGGPRPGAGPPFGNLNALKHGRTSRQYQRLLHLVAEDPDARHLLVRIARVQRRRRSQAQGDTNALLIAPEIIGPERLSRFEVALEEFLARVPQWSRTGLLPDRYSRFIPARVTEKANPVAFLTDFVSTIAVSMAGYFALRLVLGATAGFLFASSAAQAVLIAILGVALFGRSRSGSLASMVGRAMTIPAAPVAWPTAGLSATIETLLLLLIRGATKLLAGPDRLRALVFGSGVVLLFGGMAAQFVATF